MNNNLIQFAEMDFEEQKEQFLNMMILFEVLELEAKGQNVTDIMNAFTTGFGMSLPKNISIFYEGFFYIVDDIFDVKLKKLNMIQ